MNSPRDGNSPNMPESAVPHFANFEINREGVICGYSGATERIFGHSRSDIVWRHISTFVPDLTGVSLFRNGHLNPLLEYLCHCGHLFRAKNKAGCSFASELFFINLPNAQNTVKLIVKPCS